MKKRIQKIGMRSRIVIAVCLVFAVMIGYELAFAENDQPAYELHTNMIMENTRIAAGYQMSPNYEVVLENTGSESLTNLHAENDSSCFMLFWEDEEGTPHLIHNTDEEQGEDKYVLIRQDREDEVEATEEAEPEQERLQIKNTLQPGEKLTLRAWLVLGKPLGEVKDNIIITADGLEEPVTISLSVLIVESLEEATESGTETEPEEPTEIETETESEEPTEIETETESEEPTEIETETESEEPTEIETETESEEPTEIETETESEETEKGEDIAPEAVTPGAITPGTVTPGAVTPGAVTPGAVTPEENDWSESITLLQRQGGSFSGEVFYASLPEAGYVFGVSEDILQLNCHWGDEISGVKAENGEVKIAVPDCFDGLFQLGCWNEEGAEEILFSEYISTDREAPALDYERCFKQGIQYVNVSAREIGTVKSGIAHVWFWVDDKEVEPALQTIGNTMETPQGELAALEKKFSLALNEGMHDIRVVSEDRAGNGSVIDFQINIVSDEVISVVVPTSFSLEYNPSFEKNQIRSENIVVWNQSGFDVDVNILNAEMNIRQDGEKTKTCNMDMHLLLDNHMTRKYDIPVGLTENLADFTLKAGGQQEQSIKEIKDSDEVLAPNYAIIKLLGSVSRDSLELWKDTDMNIKIVFSFTKAKKENDQ